MICTVHVPVSAVLLTPCYCAMAILLVIFLIIYYYWHLMINARTLHGPGQVVGIYPMVIVNTCMSHIFINKDVSECFILLFYFV